MYGYYWVVGLYNYWVFDMIRHINVKSLYCVPETNIKWNVNFNK